MRARPAYSADERFKLLHDVYQSKTHSTSRTSPPGVGEVARLHTMARRLCILRASIREFPSAESDITKLILCGVG